MDVANTCIWLMSDFRMEIARRVQPSDVARKRLPVSQANLGSWLINLEIAHYWTCVPGKTHVWIESVHANKVCNVTVMSVSLKCTKWNMSVRRVTWKCPAKAGCRPESHFYRVWYVIGCMCISWIGSFENCGVVWPVINWTRPSDVKIEVGNKVWVPKILLQRSWNWTLDLSSLLLC